MMNQQRKRADRSSKSRVEANEVMRVNETRSWFQNLYIESSIS